MEFNTLYMLGCNPAALLAVTLVTSTVGAVAQYAGQRRKAKAQKQYQDDLMKAQTEAYLTEASSARVQQEQQNRASSLQMESIRREAMGKRSEAQAAMSASGATGLTFAGAMNAFNVQESNMIHRLDEEKQLREAHHERSLEAMRLGAHQQLMSINRPVTGPNALAMGMNLISQNIDPVWEYGEKVHGWGKKDPLAPAIKG